MSLCHHGQNSRAQWGSSLHRCGLTPRGGQQDPGSLVCNQVFHWHSSEEASLWLWHVPSSKRVRNHWGHQGNEGPLCSHHPGYRDISDSANKWSWSLACCQHQGDGGWLCLHLSRGRELLLNSHQGGRVQRCFQSLLNPTIPGQRHLVSRGRGHWGGGKGLLAFLAPCSTALRISFPEAHGIMVTPFHQLLGNASTSTLLSIPPGISPPEQEPALGTPPFTASAVTGPLPQSMQQHNSPDWPEPPSPSEATSKVTPRSHPVQRGKRKCPSIRPCQGITRKPSAGTPD